MDHNRDGFVDTEELTSKLKQKTMWKKLIRQVWAYVSVFQLESDYTTEDFNFADENKDNLVSWEEYIEDIGSHTRFLKFYFWFKNQKKLWPNWDMLMISRRNTQPATMPLTWFVIDQ